MKPECNISSLDFPVLILFLFLDALASLDFKLSLSGSPFFTASASTGLSELFSESRSRYQISWSKRGQGVGPQDLWGLKGRPTGSQGVKGYACWVPWGP